LTNPGSDVIIDLSKRTREVKTYDKEYND
jgi:hypothetical protein